MFNAKGFTKKIVLNIGIYYYLIIEPDIYSYQVGYYLYFKFSVIFLYIRLIYILM